MHTLRLQLGRGGGNRSPGALGVWDLPAFQGFQATSWHHCTTLHPFPYPGSPAICGIHSRGQKSGDPEGGVGPPRSLCLARMSHHGVRLSIWGSLSALNISPRTLSACCEKSGLRRKWFSSLRRKCWRLTQTTLDQFFSFSSFLLSFSLFLGRGKLSIG